MEPCTPCAYAAEHGFWGDTLPPNATHCRICHQDIPGANKWLHCVGCHITYAGDTAFQRHQMVSGCPHTGEDVSVHLSRYRLAQMGRGKRYLDTFTHDWGFEYWGWDKADREERVNY